MATVQTSFSDVRNLLRAENPKHPVYCIYPHVYREIAREFLDGFPGRVLYAVKANPDPTILQLLVDSGVRHFDCASLPEIELVDTIVPDAKKYFMTPARIRGAAATAQQESALLRSVEPSLESVQEVLARANQLRGLLGLAQQAKVDPLPGIRADGADRVLQHRLLRRPVDRQTGESPE